MTNHGTGQRLSLGTFGETLPLEMIGSADSYASILTASLVFAIAAGAVALSTLLRVRISRLVRRISVAAGSLATVLAVGISAAHLRSGHGADSLEPLEMGSFLANHPAPLVITVGATVAVVILLRHGPAPESGTGSTDQT